MTKASATRRQLGRIAHLDWWLLAPVGILLTISILTLKSLPPNNNSTLQIWQIQMIAVLVGVFLMWLISKTRTASWRQNAPWMFVGSIILLVAVLLWGISIAGARRWLKIGDLFDIQAAEIAKFALVILLARYLSRRDLADLWRLFGGLMYGSVVIVLVLLEPDLDNAILLASMVIIMLIVSGIARKYILIIGLVGIVCLPIFVGRLHDYQKQRLKSFVSQSTDDLGSNYNAAQARIAIGSGGLTGEGIGSGSQSDLKFLPAQSTDFIFAVVAEKLGFVGGVVVILSLSCIIVRIWWLALGSRQIFEKLCLVGVGWIIGFESIVNICMNLGLLPVSGIQLPLVSYGGTHIVLELVMIGYVLVCSRQVYSASEPNTLQTAVRLLP